MKRRELLALRLSAVLGAIVRRVGKKEAGDPYPAVISNAPDGMPTELFGYPVIWKDAPITQPEMLLSTESDEGAE